MCSMICSDDRWVRPSKRLPQFVDELDDTAEKIVDEIERVFDLVRDPSRQLAERGKQARMGLIRSPFDAKPAIR